jgi:hypothetical protein
MENLDRHRFYKLVLKVASWGCSWRDRAASTEQGAGDLPELCQRRVALERLGERRGSVSVELLLSAS